MSVFADTLTGSTNGYLTPAAQVMFDMREATHDGIIQGFDVVAQGSPNMTVSVKPGSLIVTSTPSSETIRKFRIRNTAAASVTIPGNVSGSTKYDIIYLQLPPGLAQNPPTSGDLTAGATLFAERHNTSGEAITATNAIPLAEVAVANGAVSITNANISNIQEAALDAWMDVPDLCTVTVTGNLAWAFTVPGNYASLITRGDPFYWKQGTAPQTKRYGFVLTSTYSAVTGLTTITGTSGNDYSMASGTLTQPRFSKTEGPSGFPSFFNDATATMKITFDGNTLVQYGLASSSSGGDQTVTYPLVFTTLPTVVGSPSTTGGSNFVGHEIFTKLVGSFQFNIYNLGGARVVFGFDWIARG